MIMKDLKKFEKYFTEYTELRMQENRNIRLTMELKQQGMSTDEIHERVHYLCGPLNIAAIILLIAVIVTGIVENLYKRKQRRSDVSSGQQE